MSRNVAGVDGDLHARGTTRQQPHHGGPLRAALPAAIALAAVSVAAADPAGVWTTPGELAALPMEGEAWEALADAAGEPAGVPNISDQNDDADVLAMAKALVAVRSGDAALAEEARALVMAAIGTEDGGRTLALGKNLTGYVVAADLVGLDAADEAQFRQWLDAVRYEDLDGRTLISTHEDRPNNWGTLAGASRMAAAVYLGDDADLEAAAAVFRGWLGDRDAYDGFDYGELWWQADPDEPVGINPPGTFIDGHPVGGVLPDDQRRGGPFAWPPPQENYVYTALQGAVAQAVILSRRGYDVWNWQEQALLRAFQWLHVQADYPAVGDDTWQPHVINHAYGTAFPAPVPSHPGKNVGWTDWTHAGGCRADLDGDGSVDQDDLFELMAAWGPCAQSCPADLDGDGEVGVLDFLELLEGWGPCP